MSKKKNKKLKKKQRHSGYIAPKAVSHPIAAPMPAEEIDVTPDLEEKIEDKVVAQEPKETGYDDPAYRDEKKVVIKILLIILGLVIILIAAYYINLKTTVLSSFGDWVYKILNIQTQ